MHLGVSVEGAGRHPDAWRHPGATPAAIFRAEYYVELARLAEGAALDFIAFDDTFAPQSDRPDRVRGRLDALSIAARVAPVTDHIGLLPTINVTHTEPFHTAKNVATLDWISRGRAGWRVAVSETEAEAALFGRKGAAPRDELYAEAIDYVEVVRRLCDSWEDDAIIRDRETGRFLDRDKVHYIDFTGPFFSVRGPSITPRSPQGQPLVAVDGTNDHAWHLATVQADVVFVNTLEQAAVARARAAHEVTVMATVDVGFDDELGALTSEALSARGPATEVVDRLVAWREHVDGFLLRPLVLPVDLRRIANDVVPTLQRVGLFRGAYAESTLRARFGLERPANRYARSTP